MDKTAPDRATPPAGRSSRKRASRKEITGWAMFDFANQAYTLLIITVIYPVLFTTVIAGSPEDGYRMGNLLWSISLAVSYGLVVLTAPLLGAIMDHLQLRLLDGRVDHRIIPAITRPHWRLRQDLRIWLVGGLHRWIGIGRLCDPLSRGARS